MIDAGSVDGASANDSAEVYPQPHAGLSDAGVGHSRELVQSSLAD
jgi:hypothetical protein